MDKMEMTYDEARAAMCEAIEIVHDEDECHPAKIPIADAIRIHDNLCIDHADIIEACKNVLRNSWPDCDPDAIRDMERLRELVFPDA